MNRRVAFAVLTVLGVCLMVLPAVAFAATFTFEGTTYRSCWDDTEGFTAPPDLQPIPLPGGNPPGVHFLRLVTAAVSSTVVFNTDGTLTSTNTDTEIRNTTTGRVGVTINTCSGTWTFDAATQQVNTTRTCNFTNTIGGDSTGTSVSHVTYSLVGTTLVRVQPLTPEVVTVNVLTGTNAPFSFQQVCGGSQTLFFAK
jgi:hypothetical protein